MLRLPADDAMPGPLLIAREEEEELHENEEADHAAEEAVASDDASGMLRLLIAISVPGVLLLGGFAWWMMPKNTGQQGGAGTAARNPVVTEGTPAVPTMSQAVEVDTVTKNFLEAKTVEEMLRWVRLPQETAPKVEKWLAGKPYKPPGMQGARAEFRYSLVKGRDVIAVSVRTGDFEQRELMLVREKEGLRVDWEAWAGWSEMPWEEFRKEKPQEPKAFRVVISEGDYFNFHFKDEVHWSGYRLLSPDGEESIFGYAVKGTDLSSRLKVLIPKGGKKSFLLRLKFPPEARADNQVEIVELVSESWVDLSAVAPPP